MDSRVSSQPSPHKSRTLNRRTIFGRVVAVAAAGAGGVLLTDTFTSDAQAAGSSSLASQATIVAQGAVAPVVVALTDAATIAVDASLGDDFRVTVEGNRAMGNPVNPTDGQQIIFQVTQGNGGAYTLGWGTAYEFSTALPQPSLSTAPGQTDLLGFIYSASKNKWLLAAYVNGFN